MDNWIEDVLDKHHDINLLFISKKDIILDWVDGKKVLEIGCGSGTLSKEIISNGHSTTVSDISKKALEITKKNCGNVKIYLDDIQKTKIKEKFDTVIISEVLEHLEDDQAALFNINKLLEDNGTLIITVPAHKWLMGEFDKSLGHKRRYSKNDLKNKIERSGFRCENIRYCNLMLLPFSFLYSKILRRVPPYGNLLENLSNKKTMRDLIKLSVKIDNNLSKVVGLTLMMKCRKIK